MSATLDDPGLVTAVQRGDARAFEALYRRYHQRVAAYVLGMVKDHSRAEDVTQEVFLSALRRMRSTERPIAFEPWIYAIARNACIDEFRRAQRTREVPVDADDSRALRDTAPTPDAALVTKLELDDLRGAFGGLSDHHHEALVLRELEGLSHREIGERMGLSRTAVESTLARARKRLAEEYEELATGARCRQIRAIIASAAEVAAGSHESHRLARHVAHCQPCRRQALAAGIDSSVLTYVPLRRRAARKIAALLPFPALHVGWAKPAAVVAVVVAGAGATGVGTTVVGDTERDRASATESRRVQERAYQPAAGSGGVAGAEPVGTPVRGRQNGARDAGRANIRADRQRRALGRGRSGDTRPAAPGDAPRGGAPAPAGETAVDGNGGGGGADHGRGDAGSPSPPPKDAPAGDAPPPRRTVANPVANTLNGVDQTVRGVTDGVNETLDGVNQTLQGSPDGLNETLQGVNETVRGVTEGLGGTLQGGTDGLDETLEGVLGGLLGPRP